MTHQSKALKSISVTSESAPVIAVETAVRQLLDFVGEDPTREGLQDTPSRVARALLEMTAGYGEDIASILGRTFAETYAEPVVMQNIVFSSLCEHHLLPFRGSVTIAYVPNGRVVGLSKLARLVEAFAKRLQIQERMTEQIADAIDEHLNPTGVAVHVQAEHLCMGMRGVRSDAVTRTAAYRGEYREATRRGEFLAQLRWVSG